MLREHLTAGERGPGEGREVVGRWSRGGRVEDVTWTCAVDVCRGHVVDALAVASVTSVAVWSSLQYRSCTYRILSD